MYANRTLAPKGLVRGKVHAAGAHIVDADLGESIVRPYQRDVPCVLVNLGQWDEGLVVAKRPRLGREEWLIYLGLRCALSTGCRAQVCASWFGTASEEITERKSAGGTAL